MVQRGATALLPIWGKLFSRGAVLMVNLCIVSECRLCGDIAPPAPLVSSGGCRVGGLQFIRAELRPCLVSLGDIDKDHFVVGPHRERLDMGRYAQLKGLSGVE